MPFFIALASAAPFLAPLGIAVAALVTICGHLHDRSPTGRAIRSRAAAGAVSAVFDAAGVAAFIVV